MSWIRITLLMGLLTAILLSVGYIFGGLFGLTLGLVLAFATNFISYWYSDKFVLRMYKAKKLGEKEHKDIHAMVERIAKKAGIPKPSLYYMDLDVPNAFATGRDKNHAIVAVTKGLMEKLDENEIEAVLAHEIGHVKNKDMLVSTMAATVAGALTWVAYAFFYGDERNRNALSFILLFVLAPIAAMLIRLAISRSRELGADRTGAMLSDPMDLASALQKISDSAKARPLHGNSSASHLFIVNPFTAGSMANLFATHPSTEIRIKRLNDMSKK